MNPGVRQRENIPQDCDRINTCAKAAHKQADFTPRQVLKRQNSSNHKGFATAPTFRRRGVITLSAINLRQSCEGRSASGSDPPCALAPESTLLEWIMRV